MITIERINSDITKKLESLEFRTGNTFTLEYNEIFSTRVFEWLCLWGVIENKTYSIVGNDITILNSVDSEYNRLVGEESFLEFVTRMNGTRDYSEDIEEPQQG